ncbi:hypothetical protein TCA2_4458 [Paenibacillus sp. TCA20]|uniref:Uncharacterized protein n=1 Tax=Paenibacillus urinalis TaxID=521520 RepID=A0ABY7XNI6_9BACL|nr:MULTISPECIES: hypothetical protein [Paenibacillus]WDI05205.1 hypothetical protein PUW25_25695 [Paenibacillus urinalis]GAK41966.1 hypothetical protein TCA2_4458 [Paenibacillus sp. TCA20]
MDFIQEQENNEELEKQKQLDYMMKSVEPEEPEDEAESKDANVEYDLFGEPIAAATPKSKSSKPKVNATKPSPTDPVKYDTNWVCLVYDKRIPVPEDGLTLEKVRQYLEMEYPQFSKDRTEMMIDKEQKYIIPNVTKAPKKG